MTKLYYLTAVEKTEVTNLAMMSGRMFLGLNIFTNTLIAKAFKV